MKPWVAATRKQPGKAINDDAFYIDSSKAYLLDGAGNAQGAARRCLELIRRAEWRGLYSLVNLINFRLLALNAESTFTAVTCDGSRLCGVSCGNSALWVVRDGRLFRVNETKKRLGRTGRLDLQWVSYGLQKHDAIILATDGLTLDTYRLVREIRQSLLRPDEMPEAILRAQTDDSDDVTVLTTVI